jgi:hypothetical protein
VHLWFSDLNSLCDEELHDLRAAPPGRVVKRIVAPLGAGVEVGAARKKKLKNVDAAVVGWKKPSCAKVDLDYLTQTWNNFFQVDFSDIFAGLKILVYLRI